MGHCSNNHLKKILMLCKEIKYHTFVLFDGRWFLNVSQVRLQCYIEDECFNVKT
jgi:hypothetical protein